MRVRPVLLTLLLSGGTIGLAIYLSSILEMAPASLPFFCSADLLVMASGKNVYTLFLLGMAVFGTLLCLGGERSDMSVVLWKSKKKLLIRQVGFCILWSLMIAAAAVAVPLILAGVLVKPGMNWESVSSYFAIMNHAVVQDVSLWEVVLLCAAVQWIRNLIFCGMVLIGYWWNHKLIYGMLAAVSVCLIEVKLSEVGIVLGLVKAEYEIWLHTADKIIAVLAVWLWLTVEGAALCYLQKRKEFI